MRAACSYSFAVSWHSKRERPPWAAVVADKSPEIDLGDWDAAPVAPRALESVAAALGGNGNIRVVTVKGGKLALSEGWATARLEWADNDAVKKLPATVGVVLRNCLALTSLDLRCDRRADRITGDSDGCAAGGRDVGGAGMGEAADRSRPGL